MKELTIEEKARRYDEAIEKAKSKIKDDKDHVLYKEDITDIFPELKKSEDERIRKGLIEYFLHYPDYEITYYGLKSDSVISWLEKQGEQKPADKVEPKFKVGDIIRHKEQGCTCKIIAIDTSTAEYGVSECNGTHLPFDFQDTWELVEQNPAWSEEDECCRNQAPEKIYLYPSIFKNGKFLGRWFKTRYNQDSVAYIRADTYREGLRIPYGI